MRKADQKPELVPDDAIVTFKDDTNIHIYKWIKDLPLRNVDEEPEPVGGFDALYKFLQENLKYPESARDEGVSGQVLIEFVVEKDGSISNVKVLKGVHPELDAEVVRVVEMMPKWNPGKQDGKPVRTFYQIPVRFSIN